MRYTEFLERATFSKEELFAFSQGNLVEDPPPGEFMRLPAPPMLMVDRVVELERDGAARPDRRRAGHPPRPTGSSSATSAGTRCSPAASASTRSGSSWACTARRRVRAGSGRALGCKEVEFAGQIRPYNTLVRYEVDIRRFSLLKESGSAVAIGIGQGAASTASSIYTVEATPRSACSGASPTPTTRRARRTASGGIMDRSEA